mmetsp:Transcript_35222/g.94369  ORF Transcript_35222/g.94369 Transcript_35222/m.94369 type:complete len:253 (+) Transcript_35222:510-1268(+)
MVPNCSPLDLSRGTIGAGAAGVAHSSAVEAKASECSPQSDSRWMPHPSTEAGPSSLTRARKRGRPPRSGTLQMSRTTSCLARQATIGRTARRLDVSGTISCGQSGACGSEGMLDMLGMLDRSSRSLPPAASCSVDADWARLDGSPAYSGSSTSEHSPSRRLRGSPLPRWGLGRARPRCRGHASSTRSPNARAASSASSAPSTAEDGAPPALLAARAPPAPWVPEGTALNSPMPGGSPGSGRYLMPCSTRPRR